MTPSTLIQIAVYLSVVSFLLSAGAVAISTMSILAWRRESKRNDDQDVSIGNIARTIQSMETTLKGFEVWMGRMQAATDSVNKQSRRIVGHLESERRTRAGFSAQVYLILDGLCEKAGIEQVKREQWKNSTLPIIKEMQQDLEERL